MVAGFSGVGSPPGRGHRWRCGGHAGRDPPRPHRAPARHRASTWWSSTPRTAPAAGTAFGTTDDEHLLNVPAAGMTALPQDPGHFVAWRARQEHAAGAEPGDLRAASAVRPLPRRDPRRRLRPGRRHGLAAPRPRRGRRRATPRRAGRTVLLDDGHDLRRRRGGRRHRPARPPGTPGRRRALRRLAVLRRRPVGAGRAGRRTPRPRRPGDVLLVGAGLTMVDVVLSLTRPGGREDRRVLAVSRSGELPGTARRRAPARRDPRRRGLGLHARRAARPASPSTWRGCAATGGDWRPAMDGLRFRVSELWQRLSEEDRAEFLATDASDWNRVRHRMPPTSAAVLRELATADRLRHLHRHGRRRVAAHRRRAAGHPRRRLDPRRRLGGQLHRPRPRRTPPRQPAARRPAHRARRRLAGAGGDRRDGLPHPRRPAARLDRSRGRAGVDAGRAAARRAVGVHRGPRDPQPGARPRGRRPRRRRPAAAPPRGRPARQRPPPRRPARATRWACRCRRPPRRPRATTPAWSG